MIRRQKTRRGMRQLRRGLQQLLETVVADPGAQVRKARRTNVVVAVNSGRGGTSVQATATQHAPIQQGRTNASKDG